MEHGRYPGSPPAVNSATPFSQADPFLLTPNRRPFDTEDAVSSPQYNTDKYQFSSRQPLYAKFPFRRLSTSLEPPRSIPFFRGFERPNFARIAILTVSSLSAYPALYILTLIAKDKSLFVVRLIVAMWCSGVGFALGFVLLRIGVQHLEAASEWLTPAVQYPDIKPFISSSVGHCYPHESRRGRNETPRSGSQLAGSYQFFVRLPGPRISPEEQRDCQEFAEIIRVRLHLIFCPTSPYFRSKRPWSLFVACSIVLSILGPLLPFLFGRIMVIETFTQVRPSAQPPPRIFLNLE